MPKTAPKPLTVPEYARHRGVSVTAVRKALAKGRITALPDGRIDPVQADIDWLANSRPRVGGIKPTAKPADYHAARARREAAEAQLAEHKLAEQQGEVVRVVDVVQQWARQVSACRSLLLALPTRLAPLVVGAASLPQAAATIERAILDALAELAGDGLPR